jgi:Xaa-Pro aminopeptidase
MKARKNATEIAGARAAHLRDGEAMVRFLAWLDAEAPGGTLDEIAAVRHLEACRARSNELKDISFETIAGAGPNGAIIHYRVNEKTNARLVPGSLFLVDSGGQYRNGTTDVTRTVAIGAASEEMAKLFTLVLKGHIAIARARFPRGTTGAQLDTLARTALWAAGHDFDHGTGHGVGSYLGVHEGPASISKRGDVALEPGMILSNEPGVYREGAFGVRIENLMLVTEPDDIAGGTAPMLGFETLTLAPIDRSLVVADLLTPAERAWLDAYHARVWAMLKTAVDGVERAWLKAATRPI